MSITVTTPKQSSMATWSRWVLSTRPQSGPPPRRTRPHKNVVVSGRLIQHFVRHLFTRNAAVSQGPAAFFCVSFLKDSNPICIMVGVQHVEPLRQIRYVFCVSG